MSEADPMPNRRQQRRTERRQAIVDAAHASFLQNGYAGMAMSNLLATTGGSKATLWSYFPSKDELFAAVLESAIVGLWPNEADQLDPHGKVDAVLADFCRQFMRTNENPEAVGLWRLIVSESGRFPEVGRVFRDRVVAVAELSLIAYFRRLIQCGVLHDEDPSKMAEFLLALCAARLDRKLWGEPMVDSYLTLDADAAWFTTLFLRAFRAQ